MRWWILLVVAVLGTRGANAEGEVERAIKIGGEGIALYEQRRYAEAYDRFVVADRMAHSVVFVLYMARCKRNLGELIAARALLEQVAREDLPPDAPEPMQRARDEAAPELAALVPRIPSLVVTITGARARDATLRVDGVLVTVGATLEIDPGTHAIEILRAGATPIARTVQLVEGNGVTTVAIELDEVAHEGSRTPAWIALGVGATSLAVGVTTGVLALRAADRLEARCIESHCFPADRPDADRASRLATVSTLTFTLAGVSIAAGVALWLWRPGAGAAITAGPNEVAVVGRF